jgi:predicted ATPase/DNA-binding SARP family transcriptional activator
VTRIDVLGPLRVFATDDAADAGVDGDEVPVRGALQRRLLAGLVLSRGSVVSVDRLAELMWPDGDAPGGPAPLQSHVFRLRQRVGGLEIEQRPPGYVLHLDDAALDAHRFERRVSDALSAAAENRLEDALELLDDALAMWRGAPYGDLVDTADGQIEIERLGEVHRRAQEERLAILVRTGRGGPAIADLEAYVAREPLRERPRQVLMEALAADGRRAEALRVFDDYRRRLAEELGVDPSADLRARHEALLDGDDPPTSPAPPAPPAPAAPVGSGAGEGAIDEPPDPRPTAGSSPAEGEVEGAADERSHRREVASIASAHPSDGAARVRWNRRAGDKANGGDDAAATERPGASVPRPVSSFVGRAVLLDEVIGRLADVRLVTLLGPGGVGKTRLAIESVSRLDTTFPDGIMFCDLSSSAPDQVIAVVRAAIGLEARSGVDEVARLAEVLRSDRCLIVLDNCEHVIDAAAALAEGLLAQTDHAVVLATSRERLAVSGEHLVAVPPLSCDAGGAGRSEAAELLVDRVRAVAPEAAADIDADDLADLCSILDGLPLAIELAAARLHSLSIGDVRAGLDRSISVLRGGRTTVARHRSVAAALDWSYELLDADTRAALHACAVFAATFDAADLAAVLHTDIGHARDLLAGLVECSLARRVDDHVSLLYIVRRYALERAPDGDIAEARRRHARRMLDVADELNRAFRHAHDDTPVTECERLLVDLRDATATAVADGDADVALGLVNALRDIAMNAMLPEVMSWGEPAAELGERVGHPLTADIWAAVAIGAWKRGDLAGMARYVDRAVVVAERHEVGDRFEVLGALATQDLAHGRLRSAVEHAVRSIDCIEVAGDPLRQAEWGATVAICLAYAHDDQAIAVADDLVDNITTETGAVPRAWAWYAAGECRLDSDPEGARVRLERAVALASAGGGSFVVGIAGASLASLDVRSGDIDAAIERYRWLLPLWMRAGVRSPFWTAMRSVTQLAVLLGELGAAARLLGAVTSPTAGHEIVGDDVVRLAAIRSRLVERLGADRVAELTAAGGELDDAAAAAEALAVFDRARTGSAPSQRGPARSSPSRR